MEFILHVFETRSDTLIALMALFLTIYYGIVARRSERRSQRPYLMFEENVHFKPPQIELLLKNPGAGLAYIDSMRVFMDSEELKVDMNLWNHVRDRLSSPVRRGGGFVCSDKDAVIPPQGEIALARYWTNDDVDEELDSVIAHTDLARIRVVVVYRSAFGELWTVDSQKSNQSLR